MAMVNSHAMIGPSGERMRVIDRLKYLWNWVTGSMTGVALPARVQSAIAREQQESEILIGWVQIGAVIFFAALYTLSRKTFSADAPFEPVPWALGGYFCFVVLRLVLAYRIRLPAWLLSVSVIVDMALLLGLIWSFHLQYQQPPAFYLKAPTAFYLFIIIALRALRFEARYVILSGVAAAAGWLLLVFYAAAFDPGGMPVTRDYVKYMTSAMILWGAELDKIITIIVVTTIMALVLTRARRVLVRAVSEGTAARDLSRFFAPEIAKTITGAERAIRPGEGEPRHAAILFLDLRGFTKLAKTLDPDHVIGLLAEYQARMVPVVQRHGGSIDKFLGDGIMASFGAVRPSESCAADAMRAVDDVMIEAEKWREERGAAGQPCPYMGAAVAAGRVIFGAVGDDTRLEYTVIGDTVNLAAKLEKHTKAEQVHALTTRDAVEQAIAQGWQPGHERRQRPRAAIDGIAEPLDLVILA